jgi:hypothetical protein
VKEMINNIGNSYRPTWNRIDTSALNYREQEILNQIKSRVSTLGVPVKVYDGEPQETERGTRLFASGFASTDINSPFVICQRMIKGLANNEDDLRDFLSRLDQSIINQIENHKAFQEAKNYIAQRDADRRNEQMRANMMSALDFWNENSNGSWTQLGQGQAIQQKIAQNL